ncbi:MAG: Vitamin B12 import ATP-binding protein BtuD [Candidatus Celerinatantimonas neptuna]|nr:MAG: Vitamin B12 import ATP-binding protein BtuD [Candidatus Celerinatantimonas neptuna]
MSTTSIDMDDERTDTGKPDYLASLYLIWPYLSGQKVKLTLSVLLATLSVALELVPVYVIYQVLGEAMMHQLMLSHVVLYGGIVLVSVIGGYILFGSAVAMSHLVAFEGLYQLRLKIARHLACLPLGYFADRQSGEAKKLLIDDPERLELIVAHGIPEGMSAVATWFAVSIWLFLVDWRMALASIFITPVSFVLLVVAMGRGKNYARPYQDTGERMNSVIVEYLNGMPVVKIFNRSGESYKEASEAVRDYVKVEKLWAGAYLPLGGTFFSIVLSNIVFILPIGAFLMVQGQLDLLTLLFFIILGANYSRPLVKLFHLFHQLAHISMGSVLISEVLNTSKQNDTHKTIQLPHHDVTFEHVFFGYGKNDVLKDVSFKAKAGTVTALVGPSGSGKSTIASLIPRFFDVRSGCITIGDVDIREMGLNQLMDTVAFVFQDTVLFTDTIAANIRFGRPDASDAQVRAAAKAAQAHEFIMDLPEGYSTRIGDLGRSLSGGERQRIAIARAILKDASVIVLDEATAFADPDNEAAIQKAIEALATGRTLIVVAHRLHTIRDAQNIVTIQEGRVAESGRHQDLLANKGLYAQLWNDFIASRKAGLRDAVMHADAKEVL